MPPRWLVYTQSHNPTGGNGHTFLHKPLSIMGNAAVKDDWERQAVGRRRAASGALPGAARMAKPESKLPVRPRLMPPAPDPEVASAVGLGSETGAAGLGREDGALRSRPVGTVANSGRAVVNVDAARL